MAPAAVAVARATPGYPGPGSNVTVGPGVTVTVAHGRLSRPGRPPWSRQWPGRGGPAAAPAAQARRSALRLVRTDSEATAAAQAQLQAGLSRPGRPRPPQPGPGDSGGRKGPAGGSGPAPTAEPGPACPALSHGERRPRSRPPGGPAAAPQAESRRYNDHRRSRLSHGRSLPARGPGNSESDPAAAAASDSVS